MDHSVGVAGVTAAAFLGRFTFKMFERVCGGIAGHKVDYHLEKQDAALDSIHRTPIEHREESRAAFQGLREYGQWIAFATLLVILSIAAAGCSWSSRNASAKDWAKTQNNLGNALWTQAGRSEGAESVRLLNEAVAAYREALKVYTREQFPQDWAATQSNLGNALRDQAGQSEGAEAVRLLNEAVAAHREALKVYTREQFPQD
jgi:hypothetical protein